MSDAPLTAADIRASAEVHGELGPEYGDAVVESFLAKIDKQIEARVDERLASMNRRRRRQVDPVRLSRARIALAGAGAGSIVAGVPMTILFASERSGSPVRPGVVILFWVVLAAVYGLATFRLWRSR